MQGSISADQVCQADVITRIRDALQRNIKSTKSSRTATLWFQYMDMVDILRKYIRAERTGKLGIAPPNCFRNAPILGSIWTQSLHEICMDIMCNECMSFKKRIQVCMNSSKKACMWWGEVTVTGLACPQIWSYRAGAHAEHENQWWRYKRTRNDWAATSHWNEQDNARAAWLG